MLLIVISLDAEPEDEYVYNNDYEGSGYHDYTYDDDYGPESEDQTESPLFITDETDRYRKPTAPPRTEKDDFGFVDDNLNNVQGA